MNNTNVPKVLKRDSIQNKFERPSNKPFPENISSNLTDKLYGIFARIIGFGAILGTLAFAVWGTIHTAF